MLRVDGFRVKGFRGFQGLWGFQLWGFRGFRVKVFSGLGPLKIVGVIGILGFGVLRVDV